VTTSDISARIGRKEQSLRAVAAASETVIVAKSDHEFIRNHYTLEGLAGSNEKQRQADLITKTATEREALAVAEKGLREAQLELDIATLRVQEATMLLKVAESSSE
jgi:hypothetical protein